MPSRIPFEHALLPGRTLERTLRAYAAVGRSRHGQTIFLAGSSGSGRSALLRAIAAELRCVDPKPLVLAGSTASGRYEPWDVGRSRKFGHALSLLRSVVSAAGPLTPALTLAAQIISASDAAWQVVEEVRGYGERTDPFVLLPRLLRRAAEHGPTVCLVDDADRAADEWRANLVMGFAREVSSELPLLLLLAVEGGSYPPDISEATDTDEALDDDWALWRLTSQNLAEWWALEPLSVAELAEWTGPARAGVVDQLHKVTGGLPGWAAQLWEDWQRRGVVEADRTDGQWSFAPGRREDAHALAPVRDVLTQRLHLVLGRREALQSVDRMFGMLAVAALEGTVFTADALADALDRPRDGVIGALEAVAASEERPLGLVVRFDARDSAAEHGLARYRFASELHRLALDRYGLGDDSRRRYALRLAEALERLYGSDSHLVAHRLARLFTLDNGHGSCSPLPARG